MIKTTRNKGAATMPKLALIATIDVVEGQRDRLLSLLMAHKARSLKDEPGTLQFEVLVPREDDAKLFVYEVYRDDAAFEEHRNAASIAQFRKEADGMFEKIHGTRYTPVE
jgi:(4S)-4-hydroxy-5-phosphonooxypentane-2,3-dione isomerase